MTSCWWRSRPASLVRDDITSPCAQTQQHHALTSDARISGDRMHGPTSPAGTRYSTGTPGSAALIHWAKAMLTRISHPPGKSSAMRLAWHSGTGSFTLDTHKRTHHSFHLSFRTVTMFSLSAGDPIAFVAESEAELDEAKSKASGGGGNGAAAAAAPPPPPPAAEAAPAKEPVPAAATAESVGNLCPHGL